MKRAMALAVAQLTTIAGDSPPRGLSREIVVEAPLESVFAKLKTSLEGHAR
jgi:hypothetical protein